MTLPGVAVVKFLSPIYPSEASSKEEMSRIVRHQMLVGIKDCPVEVGSELSWLDRIKNVSAIAAFLSFDYVTGRGILLYLTVSCGMTVTRVIFLGVAVSVVITLLLYVYVVYIIRGLARANESESKRKS